MPQIYENLPKDSLNVTGMAYKPKVSLQSKTVLSKDIQNSELRMQNDRRESFSLLFCCSNPKIKQLKNYMSVSQICKDI